MWQSFENVPLKVRTDSAQLAFSLPAGMKMDRIWGSF